MWFLELQRPNERAFSHSWDITTTARVMKSIGELTIAEVHEDEGQEDDGEAHEEEAHAKKGESNGGDHRQHWEGVEKRKRKR